MIEFSMVLLLLLTILFSIMEAGRAVMNYHTLYQAVSEGARFGSVNGLTSGTPPEPRSTAEVDPLIKQKVVNSAVGLQLSTSDVEIIWTPDNRPGSYVPFALGRLNFSLSSNSTMVILR
ncbi:MAG: hypothetical protein EoVTN8_1661 [Fluviibacter phosphoraccumulans EoVTN8]